MKKKDNEKPDLSKIEITSEIWEIIERVVDRYAAKFVFGCQDEDDIRQQGRLFALEVLPKYDQKRPLENFLAVHVRNRLINYKRDNYFRHEKPASPEAIEKWEQRNKVRQSLNSPVSIDEVAPTLFSCSIFEDLACKEIIDKIDKTLPTELRTDFLRLLNKVNVPKNRKIKVQMAIGEILGIPLDIEVKLPKKNSFLDED